MSAASPKEEHIEPVVSVIIPVFNAEKFIKTAIESIRAQTYRNWELILIDDKSEDESVRIVKEIVKKDDRIMLIENEKNGGAAISRNKGILAARGRYICFLDADDFWRRDKLENQLRFMEERECAFSFTGYEFADASGHPNGKKVHTPKTLSYRQALKNTTISTITVMFDTHRISKSQIMMPNIRRGQDTATWWKILRNGETAHGLDQQLAYYRCGAGPSLSSNKFKALKRTWTLYRRVERLSVIYSLYNFAFYCVNAILRRI